ncbi:MAG: hypothetical protein JL50_06100 [Peptococcaceae bacterium BICA1-7]|nr:MAG: hypothetical protein JL50_06100 [Peptococcaceae bacterium BICA1-7]HBV96202.1 hypothetical protein [Desulfotomaculum sp.]
MERFAFITHPDRAEDIKNFIHPAKYIPPVLAEELGRVLPPLQVSVLKVESPYGTAQGVIISINITSRQVEALPPGAVINRLTKAGRLANRLGASIIGLGGHRLISNLAQEAFNTSSDWESSYHIAAALDSLEEASSQMGRSIQKEHAVVLGAAGPIGAVFSLMLSGRVKSMTLVDSNKEKIKELSRKIIFYSGLSPGISYDFTKAVRSARLVIIAGAAGIGPSDLAPGTVLYDLNRPPRLGRETGRTRDDVLVLEGGVIKMPCLAGNYSEPGFPPGMAGPFLVETILQALSKSTQKPCPVSRVCMEEVDRMRLLARKHGFSRGGLLGPDGLINKEYMEKVKNSAFKRSFAAV